MAASPTAVHPPAASPSAASPSAASPSAASPSAASPSAAIGGIFVVTHVIPAAPTAAPPNLPDKVWSSGSRLEALGTVQIMIGLVVLLFELTMLSPPGTRGIHSGAFIWGPVTFITAGSVTVKAGRLTNHSLMNTARCFNLFVVIASGAAIVFYSLDVYDIFLYNWTGAQENQDLRISAVFTGLCFLEFLISVSTILFTCTDSHQPTAQEPIVMTNQLQQRTEATPTNEAPPTTLAPPPSDSVYEIMKPPQYNTKII